MHRDDRKRPDYPGPYKDVTPKKEPPKEPPKSQKKRTFRVKKGK